MKVFLTSIGCRLNQAEMHALARQLHAAGHTILTGAGQAEAVVVNTCAVTREAVRDSRGKIRQAHRLSPQTGIIATGCWGTLRPREAAALPGVSQVVPNREKDRLGQTLAETLAASGKTAPLETFELEPVERAPTIGVSQRTRAIVKVQDGCDNHCTFCVATIARGRSRSRPLREIVADINELVAEGFKEVVLTGVHLGSYGQDQTSEVFETSEVCRHPLAGLVRAILRETDLPRLRLSSLEPWDLGEEFFGLWSEFPDRLCRHLHLPLQSGCAATLRRMARNTAPDQFSRLVAAARAAIPDLALTTDLIVGFPGEDQAEFAESLAFVREMQFAGVHAFSFSPRPGTAAARMPHQVPTPEKKRRNALVRSVVAESARAHRRRFVGRALPVLWESTDQSGPDGFRWSGLTDNYLRVSLTSPKLLWNTITSTKVVSLNGDGLVGMLAAYD